MTEIVVIIAVWVISGVLGWLNAMNRWPVGRTCEDLIALPLCMVIGPVALVLSIIMKQEERRGNRDCGL